MGWQEDLSDFINEVNQGPVQDLANSGAVQAVAGPVNAGADWLEATVQPPVYVATPIAQISRAWRKGDPRLLGEPIDWKKEMIEAGLATP
jgi:hypothetical protein